MQVLGDDRAIWLPLGQWPTPHPAPIARPEGRASFRTPYGAAFPSLAGEEGRCR